MIRRDNDTDHLYNELKNALKHENISQEELHIILALLDELQTTYTHIKDGWKQCVSALDAVKIPVFLVDSEFKVLRANKSYADLSGMQISDVIGKLFWETFPLSQTNYKTMKEHNQLFEEISTQSGQIFINHSYPVHNEEGDVIYTVYVFLDITDNQQSRELFKIMANNATDAVMIIDDEGMIRFWNHAAELMFGYSTHEAIGVAIETLIIPESFREKYLQGFEKFLLSGDGAVLGETVVLPALRKDGTEFYSELSISAINYKGKWQALGVIRDITERIYNEKQLEKTNQILTLIRNINHVLTQTSDEIDLITAVCRILSEDDNYLFAWVGYAEQDVQKNVRLVASYGVDEEYLDNIKITWNDDIYGRGPTGTAIKTSLPAVVNDISMHPHYKPWRKDALECSYHSSIALPLLDDDHCFGALNIYANKPNAFDEETQHFLREMANDLAFGIVSIRNKLKNAKHEKQMGTLIEKNPDAIFILDKKHKIEFANKAAEHLFGQTVENLLGTDFGFPAVAGESSEIELFSKNSKGENEIRTAELHVVKLTSGGETKIHVFLHDITERKVAEKLSSRMGYLLAHSLNEVCMFDANTLRFIDVSTRAQKNLGYTLEELKKMTPMDICEYLSEGDYESIIKPLRSKEQLEISFETKHIRKNGTSYPVEINLQLLDNEYPPVFVGIGQDITERKKYLAELKYRALYDSLTGIPNRYALQEHLKQECEIAKEKKTQVAVYSIKALKFNEINDLLGYSSGDKLLQEIARRFQNTLTQNSMIARSGDNIFSIVFSDIDNESISAISEKIKLLLQAPFNDSGMLIEIEFCFGVSLYPQHGDQAETLMVNADKAMQRAQKEGVAFNLYIPKDTTMNLQRMKYHGELRAAIEKKELVLHYQPQVNIKSGHIVSVEALARWPHREFGMIYPNDFIPIIEQSTLIQPFTKWLLEEAILQLSRWKDEEVELSISVNISVRNLLDVSLPNYIINLLHIHKVDVNKISLEITESALMTRPEESMKIITQLHEMGFSFSLDDFGTGYSSLSYLQKLPIHEIKIDKSFIFGFLENEDDEKIVRSTIDLANNLALKTVAEGVESKEVFEMLATLDCHIAQGYYMAKPLSINDLTQWLRESPFGLTDLKEV